MELRYLRYFVAVADRKNFTRAAAELHVAQPAVSQQIKALEGEIGVPLLLRTKRNVRLTAAGYSFLENAREILALAEQAKLAARRASRGEIGSLTIGSFSSAVSAYLPELVQAYRKRFPAVRLHLLEQTPEQQMQAFAKGAIDVGFTRPLPADQAKNFVQDRIYRDRLMLAMPESHPLAKTGGAKLDKFGSEDFVLFKRSEAPELVDQMTLLCAKAGFAPRVVCEPPMMQTVLMAVASGLGVSLVPGCVRSFRQPGVAFLSLRPASPAIDLVMVSAKGDPSPTVLAWTELVRERLSAIRAIMEPATG